MVERMEKCWKQWEQPLLILSVVLHPSYKLSKFHTSISNLSLTNLGKWLKYYYEAWFGSKPRTVLAEFVQYIKELDPYDDNSFTQFQGRLVDFWEFTSGIGPELAKIAIRIHGICVNFASVERLWSSMGYLHTNRRNRLKSNKVLAMAQIRSDIFYNRNIRNAKNGEKKIRQLHIATPIPEEESDNDSDDNDNQIIVDEEEENLERNSDNENEPVTKEDEKCWDSIITEWINSAEHENQFDNVDDENLFSDELNNFDLGGHTLHPADDDSAKWSLVSLFTSNLESPTFLNRDNKFADE
ncbi:hypothetical protein RclHR1_11820007 [Rhizophagus clarus]|uniref:HAT C-terminal dimerisation domain-containing protein n=1 Tax=Rhizophagus clarus TaxID=94130 RepID=A0A2Z6QYA9_9GLOM|nr:hypothetical protein RclHR1_11820007 [Rhizophagus clarus]